MGEWWVAPEVRRLEVPWEVANPTVMGVLRPVPGAYPSTLCSVTRRTARLTGPIVKAELPTPPGLPVLRWELRPIEVALGEVEVERRRRPTMSLSDPELSTWFGVAYPAARVAPPIGGTLRVFDNEL